MLLRAWANFSDCGFSRTTPTKKKNLQVTITLVKLTQVHCFTSSGKNCMIRPSVQHRPTLTHTQQPNAKPLAHAQLSNTFWSMPYVTFKEQEQVSLSTGRTRYTQTSIPNGLATRLGLPHALCAEDQTVLHTYIIRCNNHTLKRMHINRHHHAVSLCGEEISKGKLGSAIVTTDACNSETLVDLNIELP